MQLKVLALCTGTGTYIGSKFCSYDNTIALIPTGCPHTQVQHCVNLLGAAVGYLQAEAKEVDGRCPPKKPDKSELAEGLPRPIVVSEEPLMPVSTQEREPKTSSHDL